MNFPGITRGIIEQESQNRNPRNGIVEMNRNNFLFWKHVLCMKSCDIIYIQITLNNHIMVPLDYSKLGNSISKYLQTHIWLSI